MRKHIKLECPKCQADLTQPNSVCQISQRFVIEETIGKLITRPVPLRDSDFWAEVNEHDGLTDTNELFVSRRKPQVVKEQDNDWYGCQCSKYGQDLEIDNRGGVKVSIEEIE